jgi:hypothetical protein
LSDNAETLSVLEGISTFGVWGEGRAEELIEETERKVENNVNAQPFQQQQHSRFELMDDGERKRS